MKRILLVAALCAACAYYGLTTLATIAVAESDDVVMIDRLQEEETLYSDGAPEVVATLAGKLELLAFTYKSAGTCGACDMIRSTLDDLADEYPITRVYYDSRKGANVALEYGVRYLPTFVLVRRDKNGRAHEVERFSGGYSPRQFAARVETMFRRAGYDPDSNAPIGARPIPKLERLRAPSNGRWVWVWY